MNLDLSTDTVKVMEALVASGEFPTPQDAIAEGIKLLASRSQLHAEIEEGITSLNEGQWVDSSVVYEELRQRGRKLMEQQGS